MVLFNHSTRELTAKIVYYGPGLCGKTTNLRLLHEKLDQATTGRLLSLSTAQDRTIYFDLLPVELGNVKGYTVRFQLCTVPGQVFYNETRKLVLKGADGIVFVVDSQWSMLSHNLESFQNLRENMAELGQNLDDSAVVVQYNKRDLPGVLSVQALQESLGFQEFPFVESIAADAKGVVETFKLVSKLTFIQILKRLQRSTDGERLGPDWVAPVPPNSQSTMRISPVSAQLLALTSTLGPASSPSIDSPFETTGSWPGLPKGEVFGETTIPPFALEPPPGPAAGTPATGPFRRPFAPAAPAPVPPDEDDTVTEPPPVSAEPSPVASEPPAIAAEPPAIADEPPAAPASAPELTSVPEPATVPEAEAEPLPEMVLGPIPVPEPVAKTEPEPAPGPEPAAKPEPSPEPPPATSGALPAGPEPEAEPVAALSEEPAKVPAPEPQAGGVDTAREAGLEPSAFLHDLGLGPGTAKAPEAEPPQATTQAIQVEAAPVEMAPVEPPTAVPEPLPAPSAPEPPPPPPAPQPALPPPFAAVWAEAFAGLSSRLDEMARVHAEQSARVEALARETRDAVEAVPGTVKESLAALAPAAAVTALREALEEHTAEVRPKLLGLVDEAARQREALFENERERDDASRDAARRHREEIRGDVERATLAVREVVEALEGRMVELRTSLEPRLAALEASLARLETSDRLEELRKETSEVKRLVESKLDEAGGQSRRLSGFLRRALEELEPPEKG